MQINVIKKRKFNELYEKIINTNPKKYKKRIHKDQGNSKTELMFPLEDFHIYNQGNNGEMIFHDRQDRQKFINEIKHYLEPVAYVYCHALLFNHFHFVIKIKSPSKILKLIETDKDVAKFAQKFIEAGKSKAYIAARIVSEKLRIFFSKYASYFNIKYDRSGSLFRKNYKRRRITSPVYLRNCIIYVNTNVTHHNPRISYKDYEWCSYNDFLNPNYIKDLNKRFFDFYGLFGDIENFIYLHERKDIDHNLYQID
ncbi:MAG: hypothetical protein ACOX4D_06490 [Bacteroidales bacterium]|jgi:putative transposase